MSETVDLKTTLLVLAAAEARTAEGRLRLSAALWATLAVLMDDGPLALTPAPFATLGVAAALDGVAAGLAQAADHAAHLAAHARVTAPPPRSRPE